jgi:tetratricopeptide (TPR) repeat protein
MPPLGVALVGRTTVSKDYTEGAKEIWVTSAMELFGPLVELVKIDGKFTMQFVQNAAPQTVQLGAHSPCVCVEKVVNNKLEVTPISVRMGGSENDPVVFGTCGPSGLKGLAARIAQPGLAEQDKRRVDFAALQAELAALESLGVDIEAGAKAASKKKKEQESASGGFKSDKEREIEETRERADDCFWEGIHHEKLDDPIKLFYCPLIDSRAECGLGSRLAYTEAARLFGRCIDLDKTELTYYAKRCAALCKLRMFPRALLDAQNYVGVRCSNPLLCPAIASLACSCNALWPLVVQTDSGGKKNRPESPTGHCLMGTAYDGLNKYNEAIASLEKSLDRAEIIPYDGSRVWSTGTLVRDNLKQAVDRRAKVAERARVANQHGVEWRARGEFSRAVPCLIEAAQLQKDCVGDLHLHYATCLNNLGSCVEAMGNYDDAMIKYKTSLKVTEVASPGELRVMVCSARHLPHVMPGGSLQNGEWIEHGQSCDTYVEMQIMRGEGTWDSNKAVQTKVIVDNYQPTWNQVLSLKSPRGDLSVLLRLMGRNPQRVAFEEAAAHKRHLLKGLLGSS